MSDDSRRRGFAADVSRQARGLSLDALRVLDRIASHLVRREEQEGARTLEQLSTWMRDARDLDDGCDVDAAIALVADAIAAEDREQEEQHERARDEAVPRRVPSLAETVHRQAGVMRALAEIERQEREAADIRIGEPGDLLTGKPIVIEPGTDPAHRCRAIRVVVDESAEPDDLGGGDA